MQGAVTKIFYGYELNIHVHALNIPLSILVGSIIQSR